MKRHHMPDIKEGNVNVTPLIDVVMCLIIFFMLVARIGVATGAEEMDLPETVLGTKIQDMGNTLTLNVRPGPADEPLITALVNGRQQPIKHREIHHDQTTFPLRQILSEFRRIQGDEFKIIIRGEKTMPYRYLEPVLLDCAEAKVRNVNFNTEIKE